MNSQIAAIQMVHAGALVRRPHQILDAVAPTDIRAQFDQGLPDGLNCRTAPVSGQVRKTYPDGTVLTITKEDGNWGYCPESDRPEQPANIGDELLGEIGPDLGLDRGLGVPGLHQ